VSSEPAARGRDVVRPPARGHSRSAQARRPARGYSRVAQAHRDLDACIVTVLTTIGTAIALYDLLLLATPYQ
jgi:hypothetical protein